MKRALRIGGFVLELTLNRRRKKEVPAVPFHRNAFSRLNKKIKIFVTANQYFNAKAIGIFAKTKNSAQLNFAGGAQRQAVEYLMKFSIRFQNISSRF